MRSLNFSKAKAFIQRDFLLTLSYRAAFILQLSGMFFSVVMFYFLAKLIGNTGNSYLAPYGGDYFSFVLIGIAFDGFLQAGLRSFAQGIRNEQMMGTLEAMLITPTSIPTIIASASLWNFIFTAFRVLIYFVIGVLFFGFQVGGANYFSALLTLVLTTFVFSGLGIIAAGFVMVFKQGDPLIWMFSGLSGLLGGVFYPIAVLPGWLQYFSYLIPSTYALKAMRLALLKGYSFWQLLPDLLPLLLFSILLFPLGFLIFNLAVKKARRDGSLGQY